MSVVYLFADITCGSLQKKSVLFVYLHLVSQDQILKLKTTCQTEHHLDSPNYINNLSVSGEDSLQSQKPQDHFYSETSASDYGCDTPHVVTGIQNR